MPRTLLLLALCCAAPLTMAHAQQPADSVASTATDSSAARATADSSGRPLPSARGIYGKPFVRRVGSGTAVGGYVSTEFRSEYVNGIGARRSAFDAHRIVPFIFSEITDRLHFGTEIEFEHGTKLEVEDGQAEGAGELNVEFATLDYRIVEALNFRAGVILSPIGRFNLTHDDPVNELTDRPLVTQQVIPGTLSETGAGLFGTLYPTDRSLVTYEAYVVNGFTNELVTVEPGEHRLNVREAAGSRGAEDAATKNVVARIGVSPFLGVELGASMHAGRYGDGVTPAGETEEKHNATITALDASWRRGPFEILGEAARLRADLSAESRAAGIANGRQGYYVQTNYRFGQGLVTPKATSLFTGVLRWDEVDYESNITGDQQRRLTVGLNWRPVPDAAFKSEYQWNWSTPEATTTRDPVERRILFSFASYF